LPQTYELQLQKYMSLRSFREDENLEQSLQEALVREGEANDESLRDETGNEAEHRRLELVAFS
jgi:hypothetical protein